MITWLQKKQWKKGTTADETWAVREDTPETHQIKRGTPSMGGIGIITATLIPLSILPIYSLVIVLLRKQSLPASSELTSHLFTLNLVPLVLLSHGLLGFADDWSKASGRGGLRARYKLIGQMFLASAFVYSLIVLFLPRGASLNYAFVELYGTHFELFVLVSVCLVLVIITTCNAVNLTDGIDGLAAGLAMQCGIALFFISSKSPGISSVSAWPIMALAGACLGFLHFNKYKARVFMGDTGSLAIGAALGAGAILQGAVFLLPFIGFIYFVEMFSVIFQVAWFKWTKRKTGEGQRLFRRAPLHHHFELGGWSEWRVVGTFWAINLFTSAIGLWLWHAGVLPRWP